MDIQNNISKNYKKKFTNLNNDEDITIENEKQERNDDELGMMTMSYE